jgi:hypothetical protein
MQNSDVQILSYKDSWDQIKQLIGLEGYKQWYASVKQMIEDGQADSTYVYTRSAGQKIYSIPIGDTGWDAILVFRQNPEDPLTWSWIVEKVVRHNDNALAKLSPVEAAMLRLVGPWMNGN